MENVIEHPQGAVWRRIADDLAAGILAGEHLSGASLPSASDLASQYNVHRHTVRQAYRHLQDLGLVSVEQGRGTFVNELRLPYRLGRRMRFRENFCKLNVEARGRIVDVKRVDATLEAARALDLERGACLWRIETLNTAGRKPMSLAEHLISQERFPDFPRALEANGASLTAAFQASGVGDYERRSTRIGARIATRMEVELLGLGEGAPVLTSLALDAEIGGGPLQWVAAAFVAERMEFVLEERG